MSLFQVISQVLSAGMGMMNSHNDRQFNKGQAREADARALANSQAMSDYNKENAMDIWNRTNYKAQREHMERAGLNVGLMYGMGGAGGATTSGAGSPSMQGTGARHDSSAYGIEDKIANAGLAMAQVENIKADTAKKEAEAASISGVETEQKKANTEQMLQDIKNKQAQETMQTMLNYEQGASQEDRLSTIGWMANKAMHEARSAQAKGDVDIATVDANIRTIETIATQEVLKNGLIGEQTKLGSSL